MTDHLTAKARSANMALIKGKDTKPEMLVRRAVHGMGYRYRLHVRDLPGKPDMVFRSRKAVIFVHGCFWHQHDSSECKSRPPKSNLDYWLPKLKRNVERDNVNKQKLQDSGWKVLVIWECEIKNMGSLLKKIANFLNGI